jgi:hypothetical protein
VVRLAGAYGSWRLETLDAAATLTVDFQTTRKIL